MPVINAANEVSKESDERFSRFKHHLKQCKTSNARKPKESTLIKARTLLSGQSQSTTVPSVTNTVAALESLECLTPQRGSSIGEEDLTNSTEETV